MRKFFKLIFLFAFIISIFSIPFNVHAQTLHDLEVQLDNIQKKEEDNSDQINLNQNQINSTEARVTQIYKDMASITDEIAKKQQEIIDLGEQIKKKDAETKELMRALQITSGDSFYLEYIFGAENMADFIYRYSVTEQLTKHNSELITEMNDNIEQNKKANEELKENQNELTAEQGKLAVELKTLGNTKDQLYETQRSIEDEIKNAKSVIKMYLDAGCKEYDDINVCANKLLPPDTAFYRPLSTGFVTGEYGSRISPINGKPEFHEAVDLSNQYGLNAQIYAAANGLVAKIFYDQYGGNQIVIHHNINGQKYSTSYAHLSKILVKEGQTVTRDTVIGMMGATGNATGPHLHIAISTGLRYKDYVYYSDYVARSINPRLLINFPSGLYNSWYDRITRYK